MIPVPGKFLHLRRLCFEFISPDYDYFSLVPFLDACPSLETFKLFVSHLPLADESHISVVENALVQVYVLLFLTSVSFQCR